MSSYCNIIIKSILSCIFFLSFISYGFINADEFVYDKHEKKDPFAPPVLTNTRESGMELLAGVKLEGIIWDVKNPVAIVNDTVVKIGDVVSGVKIAEIKENEVVFEVDERQINVKLRIKEGEGL